MPGDVSHSVIAIGSYRSTSALRSAKAIKKMFLQHMLPPFIRHAGESHFHTWQAPFLFQDLNSIRTVVAETPLTPRGTASKSVTQKQSSEIVSTPESQRKQRWAKTSRSTPEQSQATPKPGPTPKVTPASRGKHQPSITMLLFQDFHIMHSFVDYCMTDTSE